MYNSQLMQNDSNLGGKLHKIARASFYIVSSFKPQIDSHNGERSLKYLSIARISLMEKLKNMADIICLLKNVCFYQAKYESIHIRKS